MQFLKGHWQLFALIAVVFGLWNTPVVLPLKILVVFLHELSHGLAAVLTGGQIEEISLSPQQGGHAITRGGSRFVILSAGYLGSLGLGVFLLLIALRTRADRLAMGLCGLVLLATAALYMRALFPLAFSVLFGGAMLASARYLSVQVNDMALRVIGLTSVIYVPYDIFDDTIARSGLRSDAYMLANEFGGPTMLWGGIWLALSLLVIVFCLRFGVGPRSNLRFGPQIKG